MTDKISRIEVQLSELTERLSSIEVRMVDIEERLMDLADPFPAIDELYDEVDLLKAKILEIENATQ